MASISRMIDNTGREIDTKLVTLGLTVKEAAVYTALLRLGQTGSSPIIRATNLHGQFVYQALNSLEQKGLVLRVVQNGRWKFSAQSPKRLLALAEHMHTVATESVALLEQIARKEEVPSQSVELYQGKEAFIAHEFDLLERSAEGVGVFVIAGTGDQFIPLLGRRFDEYERVRVKKKITVRYIGSESQRPQLREALRSRQHFSYRILPGAFTGLVNINVWPSVIGFNLFGDPVVSFLLSSNTVAQSYRTFFQALWAKANL